VTEPNAIPEADSQITITRTSPDDIQQRQIIVRLDGKRVAELMYGQSISLKVPPGHHRLRADNTWNWKTVEFDLAPGEHAKFRTKSRAGRLTWFLVATLGRANVHFVGARAINLKC
jgi:hypothetical protein